MSLACTSGATLCAKCIENGCITFSDDDFATPGGDGTWDLPPLLSLQLIPVITEAPDIRLGGVGGTAGLFTSACADSRRVDWLVTVGTCADTELECFLQHGDCWRFRYHEDCDNKHAAGDRGYDMDVGQVLFDQTWTFDNNTNDAVLLAFTIKGLAPTYPHGVTCPAGNPQCQESPLPLWLDAPLITELSNVCAV